MDHIVQDYQRHGDHLLEELEQTHLQEHEKLRSITGQLKRKMVTAFGETSAHLANSIKEVKRRPLAELSDRWKSQRQEVAKRLEAAGVRYSKE